MVKTATQLPSADCEVCCPSVLEAPLDSAQAAELARGFAALGDPARLQILSMLSAAPAGEVCVCEFVTPLGKSQPTVSHHLKILATLAWWRVTGGADGSGITSCRHGSSPFRRQSRRADPSSRSGSTQRTSKSWRY